MPSSLVRRVLRRLLRPIVMDIIKHDIRIWGDPKRLRVDKSARLTNTLFNLSSGDITVGEYTFTGHNVSIITGTHSTQLLLEERMNSVPITGGDITIGKGVWIGSNAIILGPCSVGDHAVIAAGALVRNNVAAYSIVAGTPARVVKMISANAA